MMQEKNMRAASALVPRAYDGTITGAACDRHAAIIAKRTKERLRERQRESLLRAILRTERRPETCVFRGSLVILADRCGVVVDTLVIWPAVRNTFDSRGELR